MKKMKKPLIIKSPQKPSIKGFLASDVSKNILGSFSPLVNGTVKSPQKPLITKSPQKPLIEGFSASYVSKRILGSFSPLLKKTIKSPKLRVFKGFL